MSQTVLQPPTIKSWQQLILEADPDYWIELRQPVEYEFSNGREFYHPYPYFN